MPKLRVSLVGHALLDIGSYARRGPGRGDRLTPSEVAQISRTVRRTPEAVVKVLPRAGNDLKAVGKHLGYIGRKGEVDLETDDGERVTCLNEKTLLDDWDLDIDDVRRQSALAATKGRKPPKLVHKLMFSMPPGTAPEKVLGAVRNFAREEFWGQHRYVFALHTDEAHPHVHLLLKAVSERGVRLNIKKAALRHWRSEFARHLRLLGVEANATERAVRGQNRKARKDGIYRTGLRGESTYVRTRAAAVAAELTKGSPSLEQGKREIVETRNAVEEGWRSAAALLARDGYLDLARDVHRFVGRMPPPRTDQESIAHESRQRTRDPHARER
jgi:hypothetical protein